MLFLFVGGGNKIRTSHLFQSVYAITHRVSNQLLPRILETQHADNAGRHFLWVRNYDRPCNSNKCNETRVAVLS